MLNLMGLIPVVTGFYIFFLCSREHWMSAPNGWLRERNSHFPTPSYLLTTGPYRYSCNPIYLAELTIWLGWMGFFGSLVVAGLFTVMALVIGSVIVPGEERGLESKFGEAYREFRRTTPRWLGKTKR